MTDQDWWRQQVERQLADLLDRVERLESSIHKIDRRLTDHTGLRPKKNPHG
jgi:uncharacterized protein (UPF0335 family)